MKLNKREIKKMIIHEKEKINIHRFQKKETRSDIEDNHIHEAKNKAKNEKSKASSDKKDGAFKLSKHKNKIPKSKDFKPQNNKKMLSGSIKNQVLKSTTDNLDGSDEINKAATIESKAIIVTSDTTKKLGSKSLETAKKLKIRLAEKPVGKVKKNWKAVKEQIKERKNQPRIKNYSIKSYSAKSTKVNGKKSGSPKHKRLGIRSAMVSLFNKGSANMGANSEDNIVKSSIKGYIISAIAGLVMNVLLIAVPVVIIIALIYSSPLAVFFPKVNDDPDNIKEVLAGYYQEFNQEVKNESKGNIEVTYANEENSIITNFYDVLMVYMVRYGTANEKIGTVMDPDNKQKLKDIFQEMNYYKSETTTKIIKAGESLGILTISGYCGCEICTGSYYDSNATTASGKPATANNTVAVDAYSPIVPLNTNIVIEGAGEFMTEDTGNLKAHGRELDIYFTDHASALVWGVQKKEVFLAGTLNDVIVTRETLNIYNLTYEDYIKLGILNANEIQLLCEMMTSEWDEFTDSNIGAMVANEALTKVGMNYSQEKRMQEGYYDCSSFVYRIYKEIAGLELPMIASTQGEYVYNNGMTVTEDMLRTGDLIFYSYENNGEFLNISHVAIYIGNGMMVHASNPTRGVVCDPFSSSNINLYGRPY